MNKPKQKKKTKKTKMPASPQDDLLADISDFRNSAYSFLLSHWYILIFFMLAWLSCAITILAPDYLGNRSNMLAPNNLILLGVAALLLLCFGYALHRMHILQVNLFQRLLISCVIIVLNSGLILYLGLLNNRLNSGSSLMLLCMTPPALFPIIANNLMGGRTGICTAIIISILYPIQAPLEYTADHLQAFYFALIVSISGLLCFHKARRRQQFLVSGIILSLVIIGASLMFFYYNDQTSSTVLPWKSIVFFSTINGIGTGIAVVSLLPLFEICFNVMTPSTLMELADPNSKLLRILQEKASGTYQHSYNVANIAESAAFAINANAELVRVMALYHDIGKLEKPKYFAENLLTGETNPHDEIEPEESAQILQSHVDYGLKLAAKYHLGRLIRPAIEQHHGNTLMAFFYDKAKQQAEAKGEELPNEAAFRYNGMRPASKEVTLISLADACEAAVRSKINSANNLTKNLEEMVNNAVSQEVENKQEVDPKAIAQKLEDELKAKQQPEITEAEIRQLVSAIIDGRWKDRQFDMANITTQELAKVRDSLIQSFMTMHHFRPSYPEDK